ncbi:hypothetical protein [Aeropyrum camini]|uniref:Nucleoside phosphorylase domain-containing protein n=1 Tax=Aeropyrum camini SY1 = JCM 12091 TaxID=1198449 RepID=U3TD42_9CREN|nr:hypothetical protein [Aeropyrum camini]BAN89950.1 hypothetical protein ACAM_0481 [Aeropyrum camini SY1 = JCM 12091]
MSSGVGIVTRIPSVSPATSAVLLDHPDVYLRTVRGASTIYGGEYTGSPGFRFTVARVGEANLLIGLIPPYPQAVAEAVYELFILGIRNVIAITRGARLGRRGEEGERVVLAKAAIPLDTVSQRIAPPGTPLLASAELLRGLLAYAELGVLKGSVSPGTTVTMQSLRMGWSYDDAEEYIGLRDVRAADTVTAPLYALQYQFERLNALSVVVAERPLTPTPRPVETDARALERQDEREADLVSKILIAAVETIKAVAGE